MKNNRLFLIVFLSLIIIVGKAQAPKSHPCLVLTKESVSKIASSLAKYPLLDKSFLKIKNKADNALLAKMDVPPPKDEGGGYTHERHKQNYSEMYACGVTYQITKDEKYAQFVKSMLLKYSEMIPNLGIHPASKSSSPGKLFWQSLNDCVWVVNAIQAYDCIYEWMDVKDRQTIEKNVFIPMSNFFIVQTAKTFNLIHNHGTWTVTAVGMIGLVIGNEDLVDKALKGSNKDSKGGFLAQINELFSPDGYYTEGPYYHRYSLTPFILFAQALTNNKPELKIFAYKDSLIIKAAQALFQLTYTDGRILPFNDAIKDKNFLADEFINAADFAYYFTGERELLSIAAEQNSVTVNENGLKVAEALSNKLEKPYQWRSVEFTDGGDGKKGGVGILRSGERKDQLCLVLKYTSHGLSHGHYDKLNFNLFDKGVEVIQDYGSARFLNVEPKSGGRYLPENKTFALQTIAHNTLVVDENSNFNGKEEISSANHSDRYFFDCSDPQKQIVSAKENNAFSGVKFHRTMALITVPKFEKPIVVDILRVTSDTKHQYDLPFYFLGQFITTNFEIKTNVNSQKPLGKKNGYQHLWLDATGVSTQPIGKFTWLSNNRFYSVTTLSNDSTIFLFAQIGANDPNFNLRNDPCFIIRQKGSDNHTFISVIEPHGEYNGKDEITIGSDSQVKSIENIFSDIEKTIAEIVLTNGQRITICISNDNSDNKANHLYKINDRNYKWVGPFLIDISDK
ncbi:MAG: heparinase II/III family protein [Tenuifilaceae bacterium]